MLHLDLDPHRLLGLATYLFWWFAARAYSFVFNEHGWFLSNGWHFLNIYFLSFMFTGDPDDLIFKSVTKPHHLRLNSGQVGETRKNVFLWTSFITMWRSVNWLQLSLQNLPFYLAHPFLWFTALFKRKWLFINTHNDIDKNLIDLIRNIILIAYFNLVNTAYKKFT